MEQERTQSTINPGETWDSYQLRLAREARDHPDQNARFTETDPRTTGERKTSPEVFQGRSDNHFNPDGSLRGASLQGDRSATKPDTNALDTSEIAHLRHVLQKHFFHDQPDAVAIAAGSAGFCPMCPAAVTNTYDDGTAVCANGHRFPVQRVDRNPERR